MSFMSVVYLRATRWATAAAITGLVFAVESSPVFAVAGFEFSGEGSDSSSDLATCAAALVRNADGVCVDARRGALPDEALTDYALALVSEERFEDALATLDLIVNPDNARALNYRGFATRKLGRVDESIGHYLKAVALAPRYAEVREYLGEAYISKGRLDLAEQQLTIIETLCGTNCEAYLELAEAIAGSRN